jgi:hypothetical protein
VPARALLLYVLLVLVLLFFFFFVCMSHGCLSLRPFFFCLNYIVLPDYHRFRRHILALLPGLSLCPATAPVLPPLLHRSVSLANLPPLGWQLVPIGALNPQHRPHQPLNHRHAVIHAVTQVVLPWFYELLPLVRLPAFPLPLFNSFWSMLFMMMVIVMAVVMVVVALCCPGSSSCFPKCVPLLSSVLN